MNNVIITLLTANEKSSCTASKPSTFELDRENASDFFLPLDGVFLLLDGVFFPLGGVFFTVDGVFFTLEAAFLLGVFLPPDLVTPELAAMIGGESFVVDADSCLKFPHQGRQTKQRFLVQTC